jgi:squalene-hopene/tetraprenyl-beta-curcumene cyclase
MDVHELGQGRSEIFCRFVERFPNLVDLDAAREYWRALHTPALTANETDLQFGVTEFSISLRPHAAVNIRWLAETFRRQPFNADTAAQARDIADGVFSALRTFSGSNYPQGTFDRLFDLIYPVETASDPQPTFRIGYALEFQSTHAPSFKWYAEPRTAGSDQALDRVSAIAHHLSLGHHWLLADQTIRRHVPGATLRGIGSDLSPGGFPNLKIYYSARGCAWSQLQGVSSLGTQNGASMPLEQFHRLILKGRRRLPPNTVLLAVVLAPFLDPKTPTLKWDVFLPQLHTSDRLLQDRLVQLCGQLGLDHATYLHLWEVVAGSQPPERLLNVHQYASLDLASDGKVKLNVYLRSPQHITEHIPTAMRPRSLHGSEDRGRIVATVQRGLVSLADARENGYSEMVHRMAFPQEAGFRNDDIYCLGSVFQCATVCKTIAMARLGHSIDGQALQTDLEYLLSQQDSTSGGWKYFPTLSELPPDADDVAQVLLAFIETGYPRTAETFARIVELVERLADPLNGQVPTWLVDPAATDPESQLYRRAIEQWWGDGAEPEVVANLGFALLRLNPSRFNQWLLRVCDWLAGRQEEEGWWESTWYWGRTYGTWMATRLIAAVSPRDPALARAAKWWISSRSEEGCWDTLAPSSLETAFGLETGIHLAKAGLLSTDRRLLLHSANWLCARQADDGGWDASPFIRMDINRAATQRGTAQPRYRSYSSRTITTAFCIQALLDLLSLLDS